MKSQNLLIRLLLVVGLSMAIAACSSESENETSNHAEADASHQDDTGLGEDEQDVVEQEDSGQEPDVQEQEEDTGPVVRDPITSLEYQMIRPGCPTSNCGVKIAINTIAGSIRRALDGVGRLYIISADEIADFKVRVLTEDTIARMQGDGWDCPEPPSDEEQEVAMKYVLEGRVLFEEDYELVTHDITGCVISEDAELMAMLDVFQELRFKYYPNDAD